ncbi:MAG: YfhO family protein, partial [Clostridia bacterium]|nr:YfhO family protein [Clostridia bacterium]
TDVRAESDKRQATAATSFKTGKNSFTATVERDRANLVFFSIPYDEGWSATVNGKAAPIEKVNVGFMAVPVEAGKSEIVFTYKTPGLGVGMIVSVSALGILLIYLAVCFILRKKQGADLSYPEGEELLSRWENELESEAAAYLTEEAFDDIFDESDEETEEMPDDL